MIALIFAIGILVGAMGGILMKMGSAHLGVVHLDSFHQSVMVLLKVFTDLTILSGMALYFLSALIWLYLLTKLDISFVQPILALTYVVTPILAIIFLGESIPALRWVGILVIIIGVFIVAKTSA